MTTATATRAPRRGRLLLRGAAAGVIAAAAGTLLAAVATTLGASLTVDGVGIPLPAFALWTLVATGLGIGLAALLRHRRRFLVAAGVGTALSLVPPILLPDHVATAAVLVATHLLVAAIVIPVLARPLGPAPAPLPERAP